MKKFILLLVVALAAVFAGVFPSTAQTDADGIIGSRYITTKFISKEYGGEIARYSRNRRFQGLQVDANLLPLQNLDFIAELSYAQSGSEDKAWVFDALINPVAYKSVNPHIKLLAGAMLGISRANVNIPSGTPSEYKNTELIWGLNTGAELSQGRLSMLVGVGYEWMDEFGNGIEAGVKSNFRFAEKFFLNGSIAYEHNSDALAFALGITLRPFN